MQCGHLKKEKKKERTERQENGVPLVLLTRVFWNLPHGFLLPPPLGEQRGSFVLSPHTFLRCPRLLCMLRWIRKQAN